MVEEEEKDACPICLEELSSQHVPLTLACLHTFHSSCIRAWKDQKDTTCPLCRKPIEFKQESTQDLHFRRCKGITKLGHPCQKFPSYNNEGFCHLHRKKNATVRIHPRRSMITCGSTDESGGHEGSVESSEGGAVMQEEAKSAPLLARESITEQERIWNTLHARMSAATIPSETVDVLSQNTQEQDIRQPMTLTPIFFSSDTPDMTSVAKFAQSKTTQVARQAAPQRGAQQSEYICCCCIS